MKTISKFKVDIFILLCLLLFAVISIITVGSAERLLPDSNNLVIRQIIWYIIGIILILIIMFIGNDFLLKNAWILYIIGIISLILVLFFGATINDARCWFKIKGIGNVQPSEFTKIILIIVLARMINDFNKKYNSPTVFQEFKFLLKVILVVGIPSILTFLEPDTGVVLIYLLITFVMLLVYNSN